ncbi:hypothetical protein [Pseudonocardia sp. DLS-67]
MDEQDVFSTESEALVCGQVLGDGRHGLDGLVEPTSGSAPTDGRSA